MGNPTVGSENMTYDALLILEDGVAALVATGPGQNAGADAELEVGTGQLRDAGWLVDVTALDFTTTDETYIAVLEGSADNTFGTVAELARMVLTTASIGRNRMPVDNVVNEVIYPFIRVNFVIAGTTPSLTCTSRLGRLVN